MRNEIKAVLFDWDDTLVETIRPVWALHKYVAKNHYGKDVTDEKLRLHYGVPYSELVRLLYETDDAQAAFDIIDKYKTTFPKVLFNESIPVLQSLQKQGKMTGIVTSHSRRGIEYDFNFHQIPIQSLDYVQTEDDSPFHKPDPRVFEPTIEWLAERKILPNQTVYAGDAINDMEAARDAGMHFIGVETGLVTAAQFAERGIKSVPSVGDIMKLIN